MNAATEPALTIDVVSDVVCPWCYIGKRKLESALRDWSDEGHAAPVVRWHPFQLNPDLPQGGVSRKDYLERKFGGPARAAEIYARVRAAGASVGLELNIDGIRTQPNTLAAHTLLAWAQAQSPEVGIGVKEALLRAYFVENRDIGDAGELRAIAVAAGLDGAAAEAFLADPAQRAAVAEADRQAREMGVQGVPFFIFNRKLAVSGAQDPATLVGAMRQSLSA